MADMQSWLTATPLSGEGNGSVKVTAAAHSGRLQRTSDINFKSETDASLVVTRQVVQSGRPAYVEVSAPSKQPTAGGGPMNITVRTNCEALSFGTGASFVRLLNNQYTVGDDAVMNGASIPGDPGASAEFTAIATFDVAVNTTPKSRNFTISVSGQYTEDGETKSTSPKMLIITQAAGAATLAVSPDSVTLGDDGSEEGAFTVTSNDSWTVS